jgi:hypothetical protein
MSTFELFLSVILGVITTAIIGIPAFLFSCFNNRNRLSEYLYDVAISIDELGGTLLYGTRDKTVSHMTGFYSLKGNLSAIIFSKIIDFLFGKNHCVDVYNRDIQKTGN